MPAPACRAAEASGPQAHACGCSQVPNAKVFDDFGGQALGVWGRRLVYFTVRHMSLCLPYMPCCKGPAGVFLQSSPCLLSSTPASTDLPVSPALVLPTACQAICTVRHALVAGLLSHAWRCCPSVQQKAGNCITAGATLKPSVP